MKQYNLWEQEKAAQRLADKDNESKKKSKKNAKLIKDGDSEEDARQDVEATNSSRWASFDPLAPIGEFSFADKTKLGTAEFEEMLQSLVGQHVPQYFLDGLRRGIGVHHAGMNRRYRQI